MLDGGEGGLQGSLACLEGRDVVVGAIESRIMHSQHIHREGGQQGDVL